MTVVNTKSILAIAEYNGYTGIGGTAEQANIALDFACRKIEPDAKIKVVLYSDMVKNGWN